MKDFDYYLDKIGEIGFTEQVVHSLVYAAGLPGAHPNEIVIFENGEMGQVFALREGIAEILILSRGSISVGAKIARTGELFQVPVTDEVLGRIVDPIGNIVDGGKPIKDINQIKPVDTQPHVIVGRKPVEKQMETGVSIVDLVVPLGQGQRELVIGDRKTGKTEFILQTILSQANRGGISIYAVIGQRQLDIYKRAEFLKEKRVLDKCCFIATNPSDPSGLIFLTPYTAMTYAEYFRDRGMDVLLILDDMTTHAKFYREISLLARRFPGKDSYPGDIFYVQARIIERAGNYKGGSITCIPVAESIQGDLSGYIQTNLMAMTDGHLFFDIEFYNQGVRPAINPALSVTRVGHQTQTPLMRDTSQAVSNFLVTFERMKQFTHLGAEAGETVKNVMAKGVRLDLLFNQQEFRLIPVNADILIVAGVWTGIWNEVDLVSLRQIIERIILLYQTDDNYKASVDEVIGKFSELGELVRFLKQNDELITSRVNIS